MKQLILICSILILCSASMFSKKRYPVSVYFTDGTIKKGLAYTVETLSRESLDFKANEGAKKEKLEASTINRLVYSFKDEDVEYVNIKFYRGFKQEKIMGPFWAEVYVSDIVSVYRAYTTVQGPEMYIRANFTDYYLMRDGEPAAKMVIKSDKKFKGIAVKYFADYPQLQTRIKNDEFAWRDFRELVEIYNEWAKDNN